MRLLNETSLKWALFSKRFRKVFMAMMPLVLFELAVEAFIIFEVGGPGNWRVAQPALIFVAFVSLVADYCCMSANWDNPII